MGTLEKQKPGLIQLHCHYRDEDRHRCGQVVADINNGVLRIKCPSGHIETFILSDIERLIRQDKERRPAVLKNAQ